MKSRHQGYSKSGFLLPGLSVLGLAGCNDMGTWFVGALLAGSVIFNVVCFFVHRRRRKALNDAIRDVARFGQAGSTGLLEFDELIAKVEAVITGLKEDLARSRDVQGEILFAQGRLQMAHRLMQAGMMSAGAAHDLRGPLSGIVGSATLLDQAVPESETMLRKHVRNILVQAEKCTRVIEDLLERTRAEAPSREACDLGKLAQGAVDESRARRRAAVDIVLDLAPGQVALVDCTQVWQVFQNLVMNGLDAVDAGGTVRVSLHGDQDRTVFTVEDNGPGISEETASRIFEPLFTAKESGTGLGLALVKMYVESNGGVIEVGKSELGGARFVVSFPVAGTVDR